MPRQFCCVHACARIAQCLRLVVLVAKRPFISGGLTIIGGR